MIKKKATGPIINTDIFVETARYMQFAIYILPPHATELRFHYLTVFESFFFVICMQIYGQNSRFHFTVSEEKMAALRFTQLRFRRVYDSVYDSDLF